MRLPRVWREAVEPIRSPRATQAQTRNRSVQPGASNDVPQRTSTRATPTICRRQRAAELCPDSTLALGRFLPSDDVAAQRRTTKALRPCQRRPFSIPPTAVYSVEKDVAIRLTSWDPGLKTYERQEGWRFGDRLVLIRGGIGRGQLLGWSLLLKCFSVRRWRDGPVSFCASDRRLESAVPVRASSSASRHRDRRQQRDGPTRA
jgi:hypothetical protein